MIKEIINIGTSKGIIIPKDVLEICNIKDKVEIDLKNKGFYVKPYTKKVREGWRDALKEMRKNNDDKLIIDDNIDIEFGFDE